MLYTRRAQRPRRSQSWCQASRASGRLRPFVCVGAGWSSQRAGMRTLHSTQQFRSQSTPIQAVRESSPQHSSRQPCRHRRDCRLNGAASMQTRHSYYTENCFVYPDRPEYPVGHCLVSVSDRPTTLYFIDLRYKEHLCRSSP